MIIISVSLCHASAAFVPCPICLAICIYSYPLILLFFKISYFSMSCGMKMASSQRFYISIIFVSLFFSCRATDAICYYPDGVTTEPNHSPCNKTINDSSCCDPLDSCTTSGLCLGRTGFNYRGSCTDKTWTSSNCAPGCHAGESKDQVLLGGKG